MRKKIVKIVLYVVLIFTIIMFGLYGYAYYVMNYKTDSNDIIYIEDLSNLESELEH